MKTRTTLILLLVVVLSAARVAGVDAAPVAPTLLSPASGSSVLTPFTISWSAVTDPSGILGYNWQVSSSSSFATLVKQDSVNDPTTQAAVSGLGVGTYFWRVQAVSGAFEQGPWSQPQSFTVTGTSAGTPGTPTLDKTFGYSTFHPWEFIKFTWSVVPDAASYFLMYSNDPGFPVGQAPAGVTTGWVDNIPTNTTGFIHALAEGTWYARVYAVSADGTFSTPSNVISYTVFYRNPVPPAPILIAPINNPTLTLPFALQWQHVLNPQPMGYDVEISSSSSFTNNEAPLGTQLTNPEFKIFSLTPGQKFWRVRSNQGLASRNANGTTTNAVTPWSATGTFTLGTAPPTPVSITPVLATLFSGNTSWVEVQLTAGVPAGGATINLASSNQAIAPVPATLAMQGNAAWTQFQMTVGQVTAPTPVTITATLNGVTTSRQITVNPPGLKSLTMTGGPVSGGATAGAILSLNGQAPASSAVVNLESNNPAVTPPPTVTIPAGVTAVSVAMSTNDVTQSTPVTITATWSGASTQAQITVVPGPVPSSLTLSPTTAVGGGPGSVSGTVTIATTAGFDQVLRVTSNNSAVLPTLSSGVVVPAGSTRGFLSIQPSAVSTTTIVRISVTGGGVTKFADLTVNPAGTVPPPATLSSFTVSPTSVTGGTASTGTVRLPSAAPTGGAIVSLSSNQPGAASVPSSVTVAAGATSAIFTITTFASAGTTVQLAATLGNSTLFAALGVNPPSPTAALSSVAVSPTAVVGGTSATGTVRLSAAAPSGGALVSLSDSSSAASLPASVTVPAGSTSATFTISTTAVTASSVATISAAFGGATRTVGLTIDPQAPPPTGQPVTVTLSVSGRSGERVTSSPAGLSVAVGSTASVSFTGGTAITLTVSNGRDAVWSGACSSGGNKTKTCRFTPTSNAAVTANVQ